MVAQIINSRNGQNRSTNTVSGRVQTATVENRIINRDNGTNESTNIIYNQADTLYSTNQIINVFQLPAYPPAPVPPWQYGCPPWNSCYTWPVACPLWAGYYCPPIWCLILIPCFYF